MLQLELDAAILLQHLDVEIGIPLEQRARIVVRAALVSTASAQRRKQFVQAAAGGIAQARDLVARQDVETRPPAKCAR